MKHIPGWIRCTYVQARIARGRARTKCPRCGAELQRERSEDWHYIEPKARVEMPAGSAHPKARAT